MYTAQQIKNLNKDIERFENVHPITDDMKLAHSGVSRLVMLDRYSYKDTKKETFAAGDIVVLTLKNDPHFPTRGLGKIKEIDWVNNEAIIDVFEEYANTLETEKERETREIKKDVNYLDKPLELFYEQIAKRNARGLSAVEDNDVSEEVFADFYDELKQENLIPAGRVLYGAGSGHEVTYFNCFVMPYVHDSREGISKHRSEVMKIMSRGGGVGTNGSTLRPRNTLAKGVNGKSSGSVSWLDDIAKLTHLVEQGGSRRGIAA